MAKDIEPRDAFESKLLAVYEDSLVPMCHDADLIRKMATNPFRYEYQNKMERKRLFKLPSGDIVIEGANEYRTSLLGADTIFSLAFSAIRHARERKWRKDKVHYDWSVAGKTVSLIMNHDFEKPAALIGPSTDELGEYSDVPKSAAVVVHNEVNHPEHLKTLLPIVAAASHGEDIARLRYPELFPSGAEPQTT